VALAELPLADTLARPLRDLRISVTDRCQFRCTYCMPREVFGRDFVFLPRDQLLTFEELTRLARIFAGLGVRKLRLTGGEPLLRRDLDKLVAMLAGIGGICQWPLEPVGAAYPGEVARRYRYRDGAGEIGVIASVTQPFCRGCTGRGSPPTGSSIPAFLPPPGTTCAARSAPAPATRRCASRSVPSGPGGPTATPTSAPARPAAPSG